MIGTREQTQAKRVHGERSPLWERLGLQEFPPIKCDLAIGDRVTFCNDYGFTCPMFVIGFSESATSWGGFICLARDPNNVGGGAWWSPVKLEQVKKEAAKCPQRSNSRMGQQE